MDEQKQPKRGAWIIVAVLFAVLMLYVVSIGPAHRLAYRTGNVHTIGALNTWYRPVFWITDVTHTDSLIDAWVAWWVKDR